MVNQELINKIVELGEKTVRPLFKSRQFEVLKKISLGKELSETEKRYLRGNLGRKLDLLDKLNNELYNPRINDYVDFLHFLNEYYITGVEALINNGYGWDLKAKIIEVINTKLNGEIKLSNKILKLIRVKSIKKAKLKLNKSNLLKYATNEQIIKDTKITKNIFVKKRWLNHYATYKQEFSIYFPERV